MTSHLEVNLAKLAREGVMISMWPTHSGQFQANVSEQGDATWTSANDADPIFALNKACRDRLAGVASRTVIRDPQPEQIDIEDAIATAIEEEEEEEDLIG